MVTVSEIIKKGQIMQATKQLSRFWPQRVFFYL